MGLASFPDRNDRVFTFSWPPDCILPLVVLPHCSSNKLEVRWRGVSLWSLGVSGLTSQCLNHAEVHHMPGILAEVLTAVSSGKHPGTGKANLGVHGLHPDDPDVWVSRGCWVSKNLSPCSPKTCWLGIWPQPPGLYPPPLSPQGCNKALVITSLFGRRHGCFTFIQNQ